MLTATLRKISVCTLSVALGAGAIATPAGASTAAPVTGAVSGTAPFAFDTCAFVHQHFIGTVTTRKGVASLDVDVCVTFSVAAGSVTYGFAGTYAISNGTFTQAGTATGSGTATASGTAGGVLNFDMSLQRSNRSSLSFKGTWISDSESGGPISATIADRPTH